MPSDRNVLDIRRDPGRPETGIFRQATCPPLQCQERSAVQNSTPTCRTGKRDRIAPALDPGRVSAVVLACIPRSARAPG